MFFIQYHQEAMLVSAFNMLLLVGWVFLRTDHLKYWLVRWTVMALPWLMALLAAVPMVLLTRYHGARGITLFSTSIGVGLAFVLLNLRTGWIIQQVNAWLSAILLWGLVSHSLTFAMWAFGFSEYVRDGVMPSVAPVLVFGVMIRLTIHWRQQYLSELRNPDICHACGYDLRGSIDATHCPECGQERKQAIQV